jgi:ABC-type antimicrobial peptide transport system permease subunit
MMGQDQDDVFIAPWTTIKFRINSNGAGPTSSLASATPAATSINTLSNLYPVAEPLYPTESPAQLADWPLSVRTTSIDMILAKAAGADQVEPAIGEMTSLLRERHHLPNDRDDDFKIVNTQEFNEKVSSASVVMSTLLWVVASISLVVGGVGIMNIMLVSVTERTREIGLRMAVGARRHHILKQFLTEAIFLCVAGGAIGIAMGRGASMTVHYVKHWPTRTSVGAVVSAVCVSAAVGIIFGFYPAWKASRMDPIESLRHE